MCKICNISSSEAVKSIEAALNSSNGHLSPQKLREIAEEFPAFKDAILSITESDIEMHYNFHMVVTKNHEENDSVAKDVGKDEADTLYQLLGQQAATMTLLTKKINTAIQEHDGGAATLSINPTTAQFYKDLGTSMRETVKAISDLNVSLNGKKDGALEGLKALAMALHGETPNSSDLSTKEFDD